LLFFALYFISRQAGDQKVRLPKAPLVSRAPRTYLPGEKKNNTKKNSAHKAFNAKWVSRVIVQQVHQRRPPKQRPNTRLQSQKQTSLFNKTGLITSLPVLVVLILLPEANLCMLLISFYAGGLID